MRVMRIPRGSIRALLCSVAAAAFTTAAFVTPVRAQTRRLPATPYGAADFAKLRWLEGSWVGTAPNESPIFQRYHFVNDSTAEITYYADSTFSREVGNGRVYLSVGRVFHTFGANRWAASRIGPEGVYFVPQQTAHNNFSWTYGGPDGWTQTTRSGISGRERVTVYSMRRARP
jgi:hypothetical protein